VISTPRRAPRTPCAAPGCPFLTRDVFCPLHVDPVPDADHHPDRGVKVSHLPTMAAQLATMAVERAFPRDDAASAPAAGRAHPSRPAAPPEPLHP